MESGSNQPNSQKKIIAKSKNSARLKANKDDIEAVEQEAISETLQNSRQEVLDRLNEDMFYGLRSLMDGADTNKQLAQRTTHFLHYTILISVIAIAAAIMGWSRELPMRYFVQSYEGSIYETDALKRPRIDEKALKTFASEIAIGFHTFGHTDYRQKFAEMKGLCTDEVIVGIFNKMRDSGVFTTLIDYKQRYEATPVSIMVQQAVPENNPTKWRIKGKINEEILTPGDRDVINDFEMLIDIEKVPLAKSPRGMICTKVAENYAR